jgi:hypothetical protein
MAESLPNHEITVDNFGDVLLWGLAARMRMLQTENQYVNYYYDHAEALDAQVNANAQAKVRPETFVDEAVQPLHLLQDNQHLILEANDSRRFAEMIRKNGTGSMPELVPTGSLKDHHITVEKLDGREPHFSYAFIQFGSFKDEVISGKITNFYMRGEFGVKTGGRLEINNGRWRSRHVQVSKLVDPTDFRANVSIKFHD